MIDREVELNLHQLLLEDDPAAPSMCWQLFFTPLTRILRRIHPEEHDDHLFEEAALTALNEYIRTPSKYQPERRSLLGYVVMAARRDLLTLIERERRQTRLFASLDDVEHFLSGENEGWDEDDEIELPPGVTREQAMTALRQAMPDPIEWQVLELMYVHQEKRTEHFARAMGIAHLPPAEQEARVKRMKDKLKVRVKRLGDKLRGN